MRKLQALLRSLVPTLPRARSVVYLERPCPHWARHQQFQEECG